MRDAEPLASNAPEGSAPQVAPSAAPAPRRAGMFRDPAVRVMTYVAIGLVILFLATVLGALLTGVLSPEGARTAAERELMVAAAAVKAPGAVGDTWAPYVNALVANGDLRAARAALNRARASVSTTWSLDLDVAEARLLRAQKRYAQSAEMADKAMKGYVAERAARAVASGDTSATAAQTALPVDYYNAALVKAYVYVELRRWKDAVAMFDIYMAVNPTAADVLVDRGNAKASMKDKSGAEKDFRAALRFVPYDEEAKAGLKTIGVAQ
jgi:tetratricopeptide (TPR) repeat protein